MSDFKDRLPAVRFNPALMQNVVLGELERQVEGRGAYDIPDASNPFVFLLEASTMSATMAVTEGEALLRRAYPAMATTQEELYLHMSDNDYIGRFATPAWTTFEIYISKAEVIQRAVPTGDQGVRKLTIPRHTAFTVADTTFTMQYPIDIRILAHGGIQISYGSGVTSPIQTLDGNMVNVDIVRIDGDELLLLHVPVGQFNITTYTETLNSASSFKTKYSFSDHFYYARAYLSTPDGGWSEILTTHTDQVYDYRRPTVVLQVTGNSLTAEIPLVYFNAGFAVGEFRIDIYTTKGPIEIDLGSYRAGQFTHELKGIGDDETYVSPLNNFNRFSVLNPHPVSGGSLPLGFNALRDRVIDNTLGGSRVPITHAQLESELQSRGYSVVTNIDNITNRQFLATRKLMPPVEDISSTGVGCTMSQLQVSLEDLAGSVHVSDNGPRVTLTPSMLYRYKHGIVKPMMDHEIQGLTQLTHDPLVRAVNADRFLFSPLHYVLDTTGTSFDVRPYYMDSPEILRKQFVSENSTSLLQVSASEYAVARIEGGYRLTVKLSSSDGFRALDDDRVVVQLGYRPIGETSYASMNGVLLGVDGNERIYQFDIRTDFDIDSSDGVFTKNFTMFDENQYNFRCRLTEDFYISFIVTGTPIFGYVTTEQDNLVQTHLLPNEYMVVGREQFTVRLGMELSNLWRRNRSLISSSSYQRHEVDVPYVYSQTVFKRDSNGQLMISVDDNGDIIYEVEHRAGDPVLGEDGQPRLRYMKGDYVLDGNGEPVLISPRKILREFTLFLMDGVYYFANDARSAEYRKAVPLQLARWIESDVGLLHSRLLEQSELYLYPTSTVGDTVAFTQDGIRTTVALNQSLTVTYHMVGSSYSNSELRDALTRSTKTLVNELLGRKTVAHSDIVSRLKENAGGDIINVTVAGLGGGEGQDVITIEDDTVRMTLGKRLTILSNQLLSVQDDIIVNFVRHST